MTNNIFWSSVRVTLFYTVNAYPFNINKLRQIINFLYYCETNKFSASTISSFLLHSLHPLPSIRVLFPPFIRFSTIQSSYKARLYSRATMGGDGAVEDSASESKTEVNINVRCSNGTKYSVQVSLDSTVGSFKDLIARNCDIPAQQQRLIYKGRILKDDQTLQSYGSSIFRSRCCEFDSFCWNCLILFDLVFCHFFG